VKGLGMFKRLFCVLPAALLLAGCATESSDPLPSWNEGATRDGVIDFVQRVTDPGSADFVPEAERIAVFDNDGTLWAEQPVYVQLAFVLDRVRALAPEHPEWAGKQPFAAVLDNDLETLHDAGKRGLLELLTATHAGMTTDEFTALVEEWLATARHPQLDRPYTELVYQPMLELLVYLRDHGFKTFIVSGGGIEFMRPWVERVYGIPPEQVVGSTIVTKFELRADGPVIVRLPEIEFIDDKDGKPLGINKFIGRRPIAAFGNSDGDLQMLQWTTMAPGARFGMIVHHTDSEREWAYDRDSSVGRLDAALAESEARGWVVVDMQRDWKTIFAASRD
jgi:phosphoglycolate phosphatase-like HAD superfamily hydrolase